MTWQSLADLVLVLHATVAAFVAGYPLVVVAAARRFPRCNDIRLRVAHMTLLAVVVVQSWAGVACPLTSLERWLREQASQTAYEAGFIEHWVSRLLFYDAPTWVFVGAYTAFALLVAAMWWRIPPAGRPRGAAPGPRPA